MKGGYLALFALLAAAAVRAQDGATPRLQVTTTNEFVPSLPPVPRVYLTEGTNRFAFFVPTGFRVNDFNGERVTLVSSDYSCFLTVRVLGPMPPDTRELAAATYRDTAMQEHPGAAVTEELSVVASGARGPAFDLQWTSAGGVARSERVAYIPTEAWVLQFSLLANSNKFPAGTVGFNALLLNFRASLSGKLDLNQLSDKL